MGLIDAWWNVALGNLMLQHHQLVTSDPFSFTSGVAGAINQQWLAELAWASAYQVAGQGGALALRDLAVVIMALCLWLIGRQLGASRRALVAASLLSGCLIASSLGVRAQTLALPISALSLLVLQRGGLVRWLAVPLAVVWANLHGSFPLAIAFAGCFAVGSWLTGARRQALVYAALTLATALGTLVTPYGPEAWRYAIDLSSNDALRSVMSEWAPTTTGSLTGQAFFLEVATVGAILAWRRPPVPLTWLVMAGGLAVFGLTAIRNVVWVGIVGLPFWAILLDRAFDRFADHRTRPRTVALMAVALVGIAFLPALPGGIHAPGQLDGNRVLADQELAIVDLTDYVMKHPTARLFHDADWGAYLEAHIGPAQQVFIDTRFEAHPTALWDDYLAIVSGRYDWDKILARYEINEVAIDPDRSPVLVQALDASDAWGRVWRTDHNAQHIIVWDRRGTR
jgi:hypothetical protein